MSFEVRYVSKPLHTAMNFNSKMICYRNTNIFTNHQFKLTPRTLYLSLYHVSALNGYVFIRITKL